MPISNGLEGYLASRGLEFTRVEYEEGVDGTLDVVVETTTQRGQFLFDRETTLARMAASIMVAFDRNRHLVLHEIPGAISMTALNPPQGAAYDYGPGGVTLDVTSVTLDGVPLPITSWKAMTPSGRVIAAAKVPEPKSVWDRLLQSEDIC